MVTSVTPQCNLMDICVTCNAIEYPYDCCYWTKILTGGDKCPFERRKFKVRCSELNHTEYKRKIEQMEESARDVIKDTRFKKAAICFDHDQYYIPEVRPVGRDRTRAIEIVKNVGVRHIAISLSGFYSNYKETSSLRRARALGLHRFLGYDGEIVLTTDIEDILCDRILQNVGKFERLVKALSPDYMTTLDMHTYGNIPAYIARTNILRTIIGAKDLVGLDVKFIGLVMGSNIQQIHDHAAILRKMGCKMLAFPCYELRRTHENDLLRERIRTIKNGGGTLLALSCSSGRGKRAVLADYYSSWSWFPFGKDQQSYKIVGAKKLRKKLKAAKRSSGQKEL